MHFKEKQTKLFLSSSLAHVLDHEAAAFSSHSQWLQRQTRRLDGFWHHQWIGECVHIFMPSSRNVFVFFTVVGF